MDLELIVTREQSQSAVQFYRNFAWIGAANGGNHQTRLGQRRNPLLKAVTRTFNPNDQSKVDYEHENEPLICPPIIGGASDLDAEFFPLSLSRQVIRHISGVTQFDDMAIGVGNIDLPGAVGPGSAR